MAWDTFAGAVLVLATTACGKNDVQGGGGGGGGSSSCNFGYLGDPSQPVKLEIWLRGADETSSLASDGGLAPLIEPPQGGRVIFAGARATNLGACAVEISGSLRDPATSQVRVDARTTNLRPAADGWGTSSDTDTSSFANIPVCPNQWASTDLYANAFELELSVTDAEGHGGSQKLTLKPFCAEKDKEADCLCQCKQGYKLGQPCN